MKKYNKFAKYKKILLVDCENVGFSLELIPKDTYAYMFVSQPNKLYHFAPENMKIIDISPFREKVVKKSNYLDFYIMYFLTKRIKEWKKRKIWLISNDKDFEGIMSILSQEDMDISCFNGSLAQFLCGNSCVKNNGKRTDSTSKSTPSRSTEMRQIAHIYLPQWCFDKMTSETKNLVPQNKTMNSLKEKLSKNQKKIFVYRYSNVPIFQYLVSIDYDIYKKEYHVVNMGHFYYCTSSLQDAISVFDEHIEQMEKLAHKYMENRVFKKAKQHAMLSYIEISSSTGKPLYDCMCEYMSGEEAYKKYTEFIDDLTK